MIGKTENASVSLRLTKRVNEMVEKKMATGHKSFEKLTGDKVGLKPAKPENSVKRPFKERPSLPPLKKRIELIKRAQKVEEDSSLVKMETCSPKLTRNDSEPESSNRVKLGAAQRVTKSVERRLDVKTEERATYTKKEEL